MRRRSRSHRPTARLGKLGDLDTPTGRIAAELSLAIRIENSTCLYRHKSTFFREGGTESPVVDAVGRVPGSPNLPNSPAAVRAWNAGSAELFRNSIPLRASDEKCRCCGGARFWRL